MQIIFKNKNYIIINKQSGLIVHGDGRTKEKTVVDWLLKEFLEIKGVGEPFIIKNKDEEEIEIDRSGIVHRIDRETSGCLVIAKNQKAFLNLKNQFQNHKVEKTYHAIVFGWLKDNEGEIIAAIGRSKSDFRKWSTQRSARGKLRDAITFYKVLKKIKNDKEERFSIVELCPKTGRTHQLRVHMKYLNYPIICDSLYAEKKGCPLNFKRTALHARSIKFKDIDGEEISVEADYEKDFERIIKNLK